MKQLFAILALSLTISCGAQTEVESLKVKNEITAKDYLYPDGTRLTATSEIPGPVGPQGEKGDPGEKGEPGNDGADGIGIPTGGAAGQILAKASATDYDVVWVENSGGSGLPGDNTGTTTVYASELTQDRDISGTDVNNIIRCTENAVLTITQDFDAMPVNQHIKLEAHDGAALTVRAADGVKLNYIDGNSGSIVARPLSYMTGILVKIKSNEFVITGQ